MRTLLYALSRPATALYSPHRNALVHFALRSSHRRVSYKTDASTFESEVIQSQLAICLVYHRPDSSGCRAYLSESERIIDRLNEEVRGSGPQAQAWLKLCTINADENRNLASAFSVERARLPVTYFIMQGTIIDKVTGQVAGTRLESILRKFLEHYQQQMNVDLMTAAAARGESPLPAAASANLLQGASTQYLQTHILSALVGSERIRLPEESEQLDGLRKTIQQAKKKTYDELEELRRELGMEVRRLSDEELREKYYGASQFTAAAVLSALEALYLARVYSSIGNIAVENVQFALRAVQRDFEPVLGEATLRRVLSLCEVMILKGELALQRRQAPGEEAMQRYCTQLENWIDELVDARVVPEQLPSAEVEEMFRMLRGSIAMARRQATAREREGEGEGKMEEGEDERRVRQVKTCLMALLQLHHSDPKSQAARARLSSLLY